MTTRAGVYETHLVFEVVVDPVAPSGGALDGMIF